jgi:hypothetical protein
VPSVPPDVSRAYRQLLTSRDRKSRSPPFRKSFEQTPRPSATLSKQFDRPVGVDAVGSTAVRDVLLVVRQRPKPGLELVDRNGNRSRNVAGPIFGCGSGVQNHDVARPCPNEQFPHANGFGVGAVPEVLADEVIEVGEAPFSDGVKSGAEVENRRVDEAVKDEQTIFAALDQRSLSQYLKMLRRIRQRQADLAGERINRAFALSQQLQYLDPVRAGERFAEPGELAVEAIFELAVGIGHGQVINRVLDHNSSSRASRRQLLIP